MMEPWVDHWTATEWTRFAGRCERHGVAAPEVYGCVDEYRTLDYAGETHCNGVFRCVRCGRLVCWCQGGGEEDERGDYCCECYAAVTCADCDNGVLRLNGRPSGLGTCDQCGKALSIHQKSEALARKQAGEGDELPKVAPSRRGGATDG